ncbi:MAG: hypothetical protein WCO47_07560 [Methylococcus sp.]|jgi:hypothetical protein
MKKQLISVAAMIALVACSSVGPVRISIPFEEGKARTMLKPGDNQVTGRVMVGLSSGTIVTCAGNVVSLVPVTAYAREWARQFYELDTGRYGSLNQAFRMDSRESQVKFVGADAFYAATRTTHCDDDGDFSFENVANGEFLVVAKTRWLGKDHDYYDFMYGVNDAQEEDGSVMEKVRLKGHDAVDLQWAPPSAELLGGQGLSSGR